jgi:hypothetical protein
MEKETKTKRVKTVYNSFYDIAHIFANEPERNVKCSNGFVDNNIIYSYGYHFPIAKRHIAEDGKETIFFTLKSYSCTTGKHIRAVDGATSHLNKLYMYHVPNRWYQGEPDHKENIEYWTNSIQLSLKTVERSRTNKDYDLLSARQYVQQLEAYVAFFKYKLDKKIKDLIKEVKGDKWDKYIEEYKKKQKEKENDPVYQQKREKAREARERAEIRKHGEQIQKWRNFEAYEPYIRTGRRNVRSTVRVDLLRYNQEQERIETSQRVQIPVEVAHVFYRHIQVMLRKGGCKSADCCDYELLERYTVTEITDQRIIVGCHRIKMEEVNNIAKQLKWI